jgi:hypothetical protein
MEVSMKKIFGVGLAIMMIGSMSLSLKPQSITPVEAARGETIIYDDFANTWSIGATGRPADSQGREFGRDAGALPAIPDPFPFNNRIKFLEQNKMRGGRVNPADVSYFARNRYLLQPWTQLESSITYQAPGTTTVAMQTSLQIYDVDFMATALSRLKLYGSATNSNFTEIPLQVELFDKVQVNHWMEFTNRVDIDASYQYFKFTFAFLNQNLYETLVISVGFTGLKLPGEVAFNNSFNGQWPVDAVGVNLDGTPNYGVGGRLPLVDAADASKGRVPFATNFTPKLEQKSYTNLVNGRLQPDPLNFNYNDWMLILSATTASIEYEFPSGFSHVSLLVFRQLYTESYPLSQAVKVSVSKNGTTYTEITYDSQVLKTAAVNNYISITSKLALEAGTTFLKIEFAHHNNNFYELGISNVRLMTDRALGLAKLRDTFTGQWPIDAVGVNEDTTPNYGVGGRLPFVDAADVSKGRVPFADNFTENDALVSWSGMVNGRVNPNPAAFMYSDFHLILAGGGNTAGQLVYELEEGFKNFSINVIRQVYPNSFAMADAVKVFVSKNGTTYTPVTIGHYDLRSSGVDREIVAFNKLELEDDYQFLKIDFAHHNANNFELGVTSVNFFGTSPDVIVVVDRDAPVLTVTWNVEDEVVINTLVTLPIATAVDTIDSSPVVTVSVLSPFASAVTVTNNTFRPTVIGDFTVTYRAEDVSGNFSTRVFVIEVIEEPVVDNTLFIVLGSITGVALVGGLAFLFFKKKPL